MDGIFGLPDGSRPSRAFMQDAPENTLGFVIERLKLIHRDASSQVRPKRLTPRFDVQAHWRRPARKENLDIAETLTLRESEMRLNLDAVAQQELFRCDFSQSSHQV